MRQYIGTKLLLATAMTLGAYNSYRGWQLPDNEDGQTPGYLVEYQDGGKANDERHQGYISWSPADVFERAYRPAGGMSFGHAIEALKSGKRVARAGWNGKGMWLTLVDGATAAQAALKTPNLAEFAMQKITATGQLGLLASIAMKTADDQILLGWLASQTDMLADDWTIVT